MLTNVVVTDNFPSGKLSYSTASPAPSTIGSGVLTWNNLGTLDARPEHEPHRHLHHAAPTGTATNSATANGGTATNSSSVTLLVITRRAERRRKFC